MLPARVISSDADVIRVSELVPAGSLQAPDFAFETAVYHAPRPKKDPRTALASLVREHAGLVLLPRAPDDSSSKPGVWLETPPIAEYKPPAADSLRYFARDLSDSQKSALSSSEAASVLRFAGPGALALKTYRQSLALTGALADETGGVIWDEETRLVYSPRAWADLRKGWSADGFPDVRSHVTIHSYRDGELIRMITLGMRKFALPDVVVNQVAHGQQSMSTAINILCQRLIEGALIEAQGKFTLGIDDIRHTDLRAETGNSVLKNAERRTTLRLGIGQHDEGDPDNRLIEIVFPGPRSGLQERHQVLLTQLLGSEDRVTHIDHDAELLAASRRGRERALKHKPRYVEAPPFGEQLLVKAPFATPDGGEEWMWVEVVQWEGTTIRGVLQNEPFEIPDLKSGARVEVEESSIFDYILKKADGSSEGNETGAIIERQR